ncbi:MAG: Sir2 family NAD-dependent protein deacetylase [Acidobacteria bacterium]|nr:Sir2 family NAD-dependent protein deacetylase [Acidobacteriota bacterium]MBI3427731.1 Sir2 family NAD-dependent protein deacetylase [Acidobacteriota bacterium]
MNFAEATQLIAHSTKIVGFTGAGISTESGIPDFRSPGGVWATNRMIYFDEFLNDRDARSEAWRQKFLVWPEMRNAMPNAGHLAFAELERQARLAALITQNIDGLHQRAGNSAEAVIELHGTMTAAECLSCRLRIPMDEALARIAAGDPAPECEECGGLLKPATISFGQPMPGLPMQMAAIAAQTCEVFIAAGSSLVVYPAASFPEIAKESGATLIIINRTETPLDGMADLVVREEIGQALPKLIGLKQH